MSSQKRRKRKLEKQRRKEAWLRRKENRVAGPAGTLGRVRKATFSMYGTGGEVQYICVAVHEGSAIITHRYFESADYQNSDRMLKDAMAFAKGAGAKEIVIAEGLLEPEFCGCSERTLRIYDGAPAQSEVAVGSTACGGDVGTIAEVEPANIVAETESDGHHLYEPQTVENGTHGDTQPPPASEGGQAHAHEWVVFSTALADGCLMLQCAACGLHGAVEAPSKQEWSEAFSAPSRPYRWHDEARVVVKGHLSGDRRYVVRAEPGPRCECYSRRGVREPGDYERFPAEVMNPPVAMTDEGRQELDALAEVARDGTLCGHLFPIYLRSLEQETGHQPGAAAREVARRIGVIDGKGLHCSPSVVASVLGEFARSGNPSRTLRDAGRGWTIRHQGRAEQ